MKPLGQTAPGGLLGPPFKMEIELSFAQALVFRRCLFALRTVGVELRLTVFGSSVHLDATSDAQTAWLHVAFCRSFFRSLKTKHQQQQQSACGNEDEAAEETQQGDPAVCVSLPIKHFWRVLNKASRSLGLEKIIIIIPSSAFQLFALIGGLC